MLGLTIFFLIYILLTIKKNKTKLTTYFFIRSLSGHICTYIFCVDETRDIYAQ